MALNAKQKLFVEAFIVERNGTKAAMAAGYSKKREVAAITATRLLMNANIRAAINKGLDDQIKRLQLDADTNLKRIEAIASDPRSKPFEVLKASELLGKHFKQFTDVHEHQGNMPSVTVNVSLPGNGRESSRDECNSKTQQRPARPVLK